jgi:hypothetical protein
VLFLTACFDSGDDAQAKAADRIKLGKATFDKNCVSLLLAIKSIIDSEIQWIILLSRVEFGFVK